MARRRAILGPQDQHERLGGALYRDTRPASLITYEVLRGQASGLFVAAAAIAAFITPALADPIIVAGSLYASWVLTRRVMLPIRTPIGSGLLDYSDLHPKSKRPRQARGIYFLGWDRFTRQEIWLTSEDIRQHFLLPGATGSGKTTLILSLMTNALAQGSGFVLVDGKADNQTYAGALSLARRFGREDDVRVINFLVASGDRRTSTYNLFATVNAAALKELLMTQVEGSRGEGGGDNKVFMDRANALMTSLSGVVVWVRDNLRIPITINSLRFALELASISTLVRKKEWLTRDIESGEITRHDVSRMPSSLLAALRSYLGDSGGFDLELDARDQKSDEPKKQHSFVTMNFNNVLTLLGETLGHIFDCEHGDVDMRDIVLNRRILIVNLPSLEGNDSTNQSLGRLITASLKAIMSQTIGASLEGDYGKIVSNRPSTASTPYPFMFDEIGYYVSNGLDVMLAQGRGLGFALGLGFQEVGSFYRRLGEHGSAPVLGNPQLKIIERLEDAGPTRTWVERAAGEADTTMVSTFNSNAAGVFADQNQAIVHRRTRVDWMDVNRLEKGEAIILFGGRRIYADVFYGEIEEGGAIRVPRGLPIGEVAIPTPDDTVANMATRLGAGGDILGRLDDESDPVDPAINAAMLAFAEALDAGLSEGAETSQILDAVLAFQSSKHHPRTSLAATDLEGDWHPFAAMLASVRAPDPLWRLTLPDRFEPDSELLERFIKIEESAGGPREAARLCATATLHEVAGRP